MKAPRIAVVIANMKAERDIVNQCITLLQAAAMPSNPLDAHRDVLTQCIDRLEPAKGAYDIKSDTVTKPRTRKPKPTDVSLGAILGNDQSVEPSK